MLEKLKIQSLLPTVYIVNRVGEGRSYIGLDALHSCIYM